MIMKNILLVVVLLISTFSFGQTDEKAKESPSKLKLVGSNFSYTRGNIDVELLTEIIQQKQEEVAQRAFRELVFANFDKEQTRALLLITTSTIFCIRLLLKRTKL